MVGKYAKDLGSFKSVSMLLLIAGVVGFIILCFTRFPIINSNLETTQDDQVAPKQKISYKTIFMNPAFFYLVLIFGFYFVAEHGIMNWLITYANRSLGFSISKSSTYLSIFFIGMTIGRLVLSPLVDKLGVFRSIRIFGFIGMTFYVVGMLFGSNLILLLSLSGLFISILYPTLILMIRRFYPEGMLATATGTIISVATLFDITFNALFGVLVDLIGLSQSFIMLPLSMIAFYICYLVFTKRKTPVY
jgi:fucose permease